MVSYTHRYFHRLSRDVLKCAAEERCRNIPYTPQTWLHITTDDSKPTVPTNNRNLVLKHRVAQHFVHTLYTAQSFQYFI